MSHAIRLTALLVVAAVAGGACTQSGPAPTPDGGVAVDGGVEVDGGIPDAGVATSTCDAPQYCDEAQTCLRVRTPEGDARCGELPPCETRLCTTSADCASLGVGYFCDTPMSGCCADSQLSRCLPPCGFHAGWPAGLAEVVEGFDTLVRGGQADFDGDGFYETTTTLGDGGVRTIVVTGQAKAVILTVVFQDADHMMAQGDFNEDTRIDFTDSEVRTGNRLDQTSEWDTDFDGTMDRRVVRSFDRLARTFTSTVYRLDGGVWQQQSTRSGPASDDQGSGCSGLTGFPSDVSGAAQSPIGRPNIRVIENGTPGACTAEEAGRIVRAFQKVTLDGLKCLERINPLLKTKLSNSLASKKLNIACGNTCPLKAATTDIGSWLDFFSDQRSNLNLSQARTDSDLEALLLHELLHFAGDDHKPDPTGAGGTDEIYSCGRHCAACSGWGEGGSASAGWSKERDCAQCAAPGFKASCGTQTAYVEKCDTLRELCHAGLGGNALCETCLVSEQQYCDDTPADALSTFVCCKTCPMSFPTNDVPCGARAAGVVTSCPALPNTVCP